MAFPRWLIERLTLEARYLAIARIDPERGLEFERLNWRDLEELKARIAGLSGEHLELEDESDGAGV